MWCWWDFFNILVYAKPAYWIIIVFMVVLNSCRKLLVSLLFYFFYCVGFLWTDSACFTRFVIYKVLWLYFFIVPLIWGFVLSCDCACMTLRSVSTVSHSAALETVSVMFWPGSSSSNLTLETKVALSRFALGPPSAWFSRALLKIPHSCYFP